MPQRGNHPATRSCVFSPRQSDGPSNIPTVNPNYNPVNGTFEFRDLAPGSYWISATASPDLETAIPPNTAPRTVSDLFASVILSSPTVHAAVDISGSDVDNLMLTLTSGLSISGRISVDGQGLATIAGFENIHVMLKSSGPTEHVQLPRPMAPDGTFSLDNVTPGEYRLTVDYPWSDFYIQEARLNSADVLHQPLLISNTPPGPLEIVLSSKAGQIDGTVLNDQSLPVAGIQAVLIPDRFRERLDTYKTAVTGSNGHFILRGVEPRDYKIFAWDDIEEYAYFDSDFLRAFEQEGKPVSVSETSRQTVDVKIIPAR